MSRVALTSATSALRESVVEQPVAATTPLALKVNFAWTLAGNFVYAGCQWGILVVLAKLGNPGMVGQFALGIAVCTPVLMLTNLALRAVQATDAERRYLFADFLKMRLVTTVLALLVVAAMVPIAGYAGTTALVILAVTLAKAIEAVSDVFYGLLQQHERMDRIGKSMIWKGPTSLAAVGLTVWLTHSVLMGALAMAGVWALLLFVYDIPSGARVLPGWRAAGKPASGMLRRRSSLRPLVGLALLSLPLGVAQMLLSLNNNIPRYFVERYLGANDLGIFAALAYLLTAGFTVLGALGQSASPRLAAYGARGQARAFAVLLLRLIGIGVAMGIVGIVISLVAGRSLLTHLYRVEYAQHADVLVWIMAVAALMYVGSFLGYALTACHYFRYQAVLLGCAAGLTAVASLALVPKYGLRGAVWAMGAGALSQLLGMLSPVTQAIRAMRVKSQQAPERARAISAGQA